jgi:hypothetical protein
MALPQVITYQLPALTASALATSQSATSLNINLNVTTVLGTLQRRVVVASAGDDAEFLAHGQPQRPVAILCATMAQSEPTAPAN